MEFAEYKSCVVRLPFGKRLPSAVYLLRIEGRKLDDPLETLLESMSRKYEIPSDFNVIKFRTDELKISFLSYPGFLSDPHPALRHGISIDLVTGKARRTDYADNINPPILHRKETFLPSDHPRYAEFAALTEAEEAAGLYENTATIGFKLNWEQLLAAKRLMIIGHTLRRREDTPTKEQPAAPLIERHKTALTRYDLSKPVKTLLEYGLLRPPTTFFDYGCGQGSDIRGLRALGFSADAWDPVYRSDVPRHEADVINLGYVLNVIEDPAERLEALVDAHRYSTRLLVVSALITETVETGRAAPYRDGILTSRKTFQKCCEQQELQQYLEDALETTAVPVALGVFYVFRQPAAQQDFLSARSRRAIDWTQISSRLGLGEPPSSRWHVLYEQHKELLDAFGDLALRLGRFPGPAEFDRLSDLCDRIGSAKRALRAFVLGGGAKGADWAEISARFGLGQPPKARWEILYAQHQAVLDAFWTIALQCGRIPAPEEFPGFAELCAAVGSAKQALRLLLRRGGGPALERAAEDRRKDLLVYVALANLRKRVPFGHLSASLRLDPRAFFGNYTRALQMGLDLLYAAGDPGEIELACEELKVGWQDAQALYLHRSLVEQLPPVLRAYVGCATALFGDVAQADVVKLHKASGKVTFLAYDDFEGKPLPELRQRIKVNLRTRWVQAFDHSSDGQLLFFKEQLLPPSHPRRPDMEAFSAKLRKLGIAEGPGFGLTKVEFASLLQKHGLNERLNKQRR